MIRHALYFIPSEQSDLWRGGCSILGYDAARGVDVDYPDHPLFHDPAMLGWTAAPRRYGFHATLKAPFVLAPGRSEEDLAHRLEIFAAAQEPCEIMLDLVAFEGFLALMPVEPSLAVVRLAETCVRSFDDFRAPLTAADRERRHPDRLSPREVEQLDRWGYPHIFEDFRFHMTLTGALDAIDQKRLEPVLRQCLEPLPRRTAIDGIALFRQDDAESRFHVLRRWPFGGG